MTYKYIYNQKIKNHSHMLYTYTYYIPKPKFNVYPEGGHKLWQKLKYAVLLQGVNV